VFFELGAMMLVEGYDDASYGHAKVIYFDILGIWFRGWGVARVAGVSRAGV
jgi:hypothetical protein